MVRGGVCGMEKSKEEKNCSRELVATQAMLPFGGGPTSGPCRTHTAGGQHFFEAWVVVFEDEPDRPVRDYLGYNFCEDRAEAVRIGHLVATGLEGKRCKVRKIEWRWKE